MSSYKLTFNDRVATVPNWAGYVSYPQPSTKPYFIFEFADSSINPNNDSTKLVNREYTDKIIWTQISSSPNRWKIEITRYSYIQVQMGMGISCLFAADDGDGNGRLTMSCKLIDSGNFDYVDLNNNHCNSFDRTFAGCTGLTEISPILYAGTYLTNVAGMFKNCTNITTGALAQYNYFNTYGTNISNHSGTFTDCGSNTQTGSAELVQIPVGWGGTLIPSSTLMTSERRAYSSSNYTAWIILGNAPDWDDIIGMYLFTEGSVGQYTGVSMNRSRIPNPLNGLGTAQGSYALYFYPAFVQCKYIPGKKNNSVSWIATTDTPNGYLTTSQGNTDMPGTLDYSSYGPFTREYGTYDSTQDVYFVFLVTNVPIAQWGGLNDAMGFLYSQYYNSDASLRYFF